MAADHDGLDETVPINTQISKEVIKKKTDSAKAISKEEQMNEEKKGLMKNLYMICIAFLMNFISFNGAASLQSSLNYEEGLGTWSLSIIYAALIISSTLSPTFLIAKLGCKWTICLSIIGYSSYPLANFYPTWGTLVPCSILLGLSAAPLWSAKSTYLTTSAKKYSVLSDETADAVVNRFFGIFFLFFQLNNIIGQLISSFVLSSGDSANLELPECFNETYIENHCGSNDCQEDFNKIRRNFSSEECPFNQIQTEGVPQQLIYVLMGIYTVVGLLGAVVVAVFVDPIVIRLEETRGFFDLFSASVKHMSDRRQMLLILITAYSGFEQAFLTGDYTRSFISCPLAINWIGFVLICYGALDSVCSFAFGRLEKHTGRYSLFAFAFVINFTLIIAFMKFSRGGASTIIYTKCSADDTLKAWYPYPTNQTMFFLLPALWGVADAVWQTQLNACYGVFFLSNQEAAFANYRLWESVGFTIAFAYQSFLCVSTKLWILLIVLVVGMALYTLAERLERKFFAVESSRTERSSF